MGGCGGSRGWSVHHPDQCLVPTRIAGGSARWERGPGAASGASPPSIPSGSAHLRAWGPDLPAGSRGLICTHLTQVLCVQGICTWSGGHSVVSNS